MGEYKLTWLTDIHLNFCNEKKIRSLCEKIVYERSNGVIITGDISEADQLIDHLAFLHMNINCPIFFVCGNHDYYGTSIVELRKVLSEMFTYTETQKYIEDDSIAWLGSSGVVPLTEKTALIGADGWYDGGYANWFQSKIQLVDYQIIAELGYMCNNKYTRHDRLNEFAKSSADYVKENLELALGKFEQVYVATHVAPFPENAVHNGKISDSNWLPHFSSKHMGDALLEIAKKYPDKPITVLCGHSHGSADNMILPNLRCITGHARYKHPKISAVFNIT